ncbi:MAG: terminase small subunit, partial [Xanthomonadaceae bacterium]|nr:terminase small subunit [Xanthomonadaceae bacterium]
PFAPRWGGHFLSFIKGLTLSLRSSSQPVRDMADRPGTGAPVVKKKELAKLLGISRQTLDQWVERWSDFPVLERGRNGREWQFDPDAVIAFLRAKREEERERKEARDELLAQLVLPLGGDEEAPTVGLSIGDQLKAAQLSRLHREEAEKLGRLVDRGEVEAVLSEVLPEMQRASREAMRRACQDMRFPEEHVLRIDAAIVEAQRRVVRELQVKLGATEIEAYLHE